MIDRRQPLYLAGQTGSGKTGVALELARRIPGTEIVNADAFQVYRGLEILSAAPSEEERSACPHHLFGILGPGEECDAARFAKRARETIADVLSRQGFPLVVGGSGLYLKAITHGLAPTPKGDEELRARLEKLSLDELVSRYRTVDPKGAEQTNLLNRRYVTRNLEISLLAGRPASEIKAEWQDNAPKIQAVYLERPREDLYARINRRTDEMFEQGIVDEVRALPSLSTTASRAIGIREIRDHLAGNLDLESCREQIRQATRRFAKRQASWFRREQEFVRLPVSEDSGPDSLAEAILAPGFGFHSPA